MMMKSKKNPNQDLRKWGVIFFQVGLILSLFIVWRFIEKTSETPVPTESKNEVAQTIASEPMPMTRPVTTKKQKAKPKQQKQPKNSDKVEETDEPDPPEFTKPKANVPAQGSDEPKVASVDSIVSVPQKDPVATVPYVNLGRVPVFPGCEELEGNEAKTACMNRKMQEFIVNRFDISLANELGFTGKMKIRGFFLINEEGEVVDIKVSAKHEKLKAEAKRIMELLPKMTPGSQAGNPVRVHYQVPISFEIQ